MLTTTSASNHKATRGAVVLMLLIGAITWLPGQEAPQSPSDQFIPNIGSHSGSPLLLEFSIPDPQGGITAVAVESPVSYSSYRIQPNPDREAVH